MSISSFNFIVKLVSTYHSLHLLFAHHAFLSCLYVCHMYTVGSNYITRTLILIKVYYTATFTRQHPLSWCGLYGDSWSRRNCCMITATTICFFRQNNLKFRWLTDFVIKISNSCYRFSLPATIFWQAMSVSSCYHLFSVSLAVPWAIHICCPLPFATLLHQHFMR